MADDDQTHHVNDPSGLTTRLERQLALVREHDTDADRQAMLAWANTMLVNDMAAATVTNRLNPIRKLAERSDSPLVEYENAGQVTELLARLKDGSHPHVKDDGLSSGTLRAYRQAARLFFRDALEYEWGEDIEIGQPDPTPVTEDQILTSAEVSRFLDTSDNDRDTAFFSVGVVTGQRISALLSLRVGDVDLGERTATITLNQDAEGLKGAAGPRPLLWARPYVAGWLRNHPNRHDETAPLFCATKAGRRPRDGGGFVTWDVGDHLSPSQMRNRLSDVAAAADIDAAKVKPHNLRHTAVTRMRDNGTPDDRIRFMIGVAEDSRILERYDRAENDRMLARIREEHGIETDTDAVGAPPLEMCPQCTTPVREGARFCDSCGLPFSERAADASKDMTSGAAADMADLTDTEKLQIAREGIEDLMDDPDFQREVVEELVDRHGSSP
jgi:integrase